MRLLHSKDLVFKEFVGENIPRYAIISHRWGEEEVSYQDFLEERRKYRWVRRQDYGWVKIAKAGQLALKRGLEWFWIDTCE